MQLNRAEFLFMNKMANQPELPDNLPMNHRAYVLPFKDIRF
jgi:hypothetical protein